ncbi:MAG: 4-hydroxy-tetrahydrodipicolinate synthase [Planctomycetota bacterium]
MLSGSIVALVTPWKDGAIDADAVRRMVEHQVANGTGALLPCGTTGESPAFTHAEQAEMIGLTVEAAAGRVPVLAGAGSNCTAEAVDLAVKAEEAGADAVLTIVPYYNKPNQEGIFQHFRAVAESCGLPLMLYNVPGRTGTNLLPETAARVAEIGNVVGVKEASGDLQQAWQLLRLGVDVYSGEDNLTFPLLCLGARGTVSVVANFAPRLIADLCAAVAARDLDRARELQAAVCELWAVAFCETNPIPAKTAMAALGFCTEEFRLPLVPMTEAGKQRLLATMRTHDLLAK